ncbi:class I SAM-dependent methyltransferase [Parahalioglobus pacificus]|uniref:Methyltransferase type 11 domain-containing protein n=1 Tax=Parahalioglobus pacificus TaxID=930806 RepID=A0A919CM60_9GAMM|nr:class I SAM-dependent methyltransferase [Halioglobus pacificus]GHD38809.1 hypothetical protein GCM10007053_29730 [Halioglobus pacificus]
MSDERKLSNPLFLQFYYLTSDIEAFLNCVAAGSTLLDIGCGSKPYAGLVDSSVRYIGIDADLENIHLDICASAYSIPLAELSVDVVVSFQVFEHLEEPYLALSEAYRVLRGGGSICITVPMSEQLHEEPRDFFRYTEYGLEYLLRKAGFDDIQVTRQGTNAANIGRRLATELSGSIVTRWVVPLINWFFMKVERRQGSDVMNYLAVARKT